MKAKSMKVGSTEAIKSALAESMADGFKPTLAVVFLSIRQNRTAICKILDEAGIAVYGAPAKREFIDEETEKGSAAMLLPDIKKEPFQIYFEDHPEKNYREVSGAVAKRAKEKFATPAFCRCRQQS